MSSNPNKDISIKTFDQTMDNLDVGTIWFQDGSFLDSAKGLVGTAGGLSFHYTVNIQNQSPPNGTSLNDGAIRFNNQTIAESTKLHISTRTNIISGYHTGTPIDMKPFFNWVKLRESSVKTIVSIFKRDDSSKKVIFSVININVDTTLTNAEFILSQEVNLISDSVVKY